MKKYILKGINSEVEVCQVCGKGNLKRVAWLQEKDENGNDIGDVVAVGMDCAGKMLSWSSARTRKNIEVADDFDKVVGKAKKLAAEYGKEKTLDWIIRMHPSRIWAKASTGNLVIYNEVEEFKRFAKIW